MNPTKVSYKGETHTIEEWAVIFGIDKITLYNNLKKHNFSLDAALNTAGQKRERLIEYNGKAQNLTQWSAELHIPYYCLRSRLNNLKWTVEKAFTTPYGGDKNDN